MNPAQSASLHSAATNGSARVILQHLNRGAPINAPDADGMTALHLAIKAGHVEAVKLLLDRGANIETPAGPLANRPVHFAAMSLNPALMATVLMYRPNLETRVNGMPPLFYAISGGDEKVVRLLLEAGADVKARSSLGESVLHMAAGSWKNNLLPTLLQHGADVRATSRNPDGKTAVHFAAEFGNADAIKRLVAAGADPFAELIDGRNALHVAAKGGFVDAAAALLDCGLDPLVEHQHGMTAVHDAALHKKIKAFYFLLDKSAGRMPEASKIHLGIVAASAGGLDVLKRLHDEGFPLLRQNDRGDTALSLAAYCGHKDAAIYLLRLGADPRQKSDQGLTSAHMAEIGKHPDLVRLLREAEQQRTKGVPSADLFPDHKDTLPQSDRADEGDTLAYIMSVQATRRIVANQEPPGMFGCNLCKGLDFRRGKPDDAEVVFIMGLAATRQAAAQGCKSCQFICACLLRAVGVFGSNLWGNAPELRIVLHSVAAGAPLLLHLQGFDPSFFPPKRLEIFVKEGTGTTWPVLGIGRDASPSTWSDERAGIARNLVRDCIEDHPECSHRSGPLPTRAIRVGSDTEEPRLHISEGENAPYIALSHCWGGMSPLTTTSDTLPERLRRIPLRTLPKTFRDAVEITRSLGVEYLWIDSLCILQDSDEDWKKEAAKMKDVYANCHVMIAAADSQNPEGGCLSNLDTNTRSYTVDSIGPWLSKVRAYIRMTTLRDPFHLEVCHRIGTPTTLNQARSILNTRGWCLQERILAPRILHFGQSEFAWECPATITCECQGPAVAALDKESRFKALLADRILREAQPNNNDNNNNDKPAVDILLWMNIIQEFTRRQLTYTTDTLHALSGLASCMATATGSDYLCGLWRTDVHEFLMWKVNYEMHTSAAGFKNMAARPFEVQTHYDAFNATVKPKGHEKEHAVPSWSWASVVAPIVFQIGRLDVSDKDQISHVRKDGRLEMRRDTRVSLLGDVKVQCEADLVSPFGPPKGRAVMKVCGLTAGVVWERKEKGYGAEFSQSKNGGLLVYKAPAGESDLPRMESLSLESKSSVTADFEPDLRDEELDVSIGDSLLLLFVLKDLEARVPQNRKEPGAGAESMFAKKGTMLEGLVLAPAGTDDIGVEGPVYRRVGMFTTANETWGKLQVMGTVTVI
ncbi:hypothetical protein OQA88_10223 [Cercophora sp. LCS_1]